MPITTGACTLHSFAPSTDSSPAAPTSVAAAVPKKYTAASPGACVR